MNAGEILVIGCDFSQGKDVDVVAVGRLVSGVVEVINVFQGEEALELYKKLTSKGEK